MNEKHDTGAYKFECCQRQQMAVMDYTKQQMNWSDPIEKRVNRMCLKCYTHWFGPPDSITKYSRKEWDAWISSDDL